LRYTDEVERDFLTAARTTQLIRENSGPEFNEEIELRRLLDRPAPPRDDFPAPPQNNGTRQCLFSLSETASFSFGSCAFGVCMSACNL
jgi:hypothetical protein